jgi:hypothetical protein
VSDSRVAHPTFQVHRKPEYRNEARVAPGDLSGFHRRLAV